MLGMYTLEKIKCKNARLNGLLLETNTRTLNYTWLATFNLTKQKKAVQLFDYIHSLDNEKTCI